MPDMVTTTGLVATELRTMTTNQGVRIVNFRLASSQRRYNKAKQEWEYGETNWFTVNAFRSLATNLASSIVKGDRVLVTGRLRIRHWENGERSGIAVDIDADSIGHDLNWGSAVFSRSVTKSAPKPEESAGDAATDDAGADRENAQAGPEGSDNFLPEAGSTDENGWALPTASVA